MNKTDERVWPHVQLNILTVRRLANPERDGYDYWRESDLKSVAEACREHLCSIERSGGEENTGETN